ncbi:MAG: polysaccharide biosynthesis/export protein [Gammaproteobacteria bacterium]|jgi:polysaccharide export outer membrane protein|nr:polysaccharide biosynthesis/export protein [Gammaproteobacteria bacterium]
MTLRLCSKAWAGMLLVALSGGCTSFISSSGPKRSEIMNSSAIMVQNVPKPTLGFALVHVDSVVASQLKSHDKPARFNADFVDQLRSSIVIGVGDVLQVTIFETGSGGLFIPTDAGSRPGNFVQLPPQQVGQDQNITVPWAGKIRVAGRTPLDVQADIEQKLRSHALKPQVVVSFAERHANEVSVVGDVGLALRFSMDASGERVLGAIARAQGPRFPDYETLVTVQRHGRAETALLAEIAKDPLQNVELEPGDVVYVEHEPRYFLAIGATGQSTTLSQLDRRFPFGDKEISLADALALAGGLEDDRANARAVFVYRYETRAAITSLGLTVPTSLPQQIPTIYALDLTDAPAFFLASRIAMRNGDTIYVSNAPVTDINKLFTLLLPLTESASFSRSTGN